MKIDLYEFSSPEIIRILGARFKEYRKFRNLTQKEVAEKCSISLSTLQKFESGTSYNITLLTLISLLKLVNRVNALEELLPELPESIYLIHSKKKRQRVKHTKS